MDWLIIALSAISMLCVIGARLWRGMLLMKDHTGALYERKKRQIYIVRFSGLGLLIVALILLAVPSSE